MTYYAKYRTIKHASEGFFKDQNSKFYAFAFPVETEDEIQEYRNQLRKKYYDARHHVYAFVLGEDKSIYRASDDGEPHNSSGPPVLNAIKSYDLTNVLVVVVRYFGGKKLGIPGLINAYRTAAEEALKNAEVIEKLPMQEITVECEFSKLNEVLRYVNQNDIKIISQTYDQKSHLRLLADKNKIDEYLEFFRNRKIEAKKI